MKKFLTFFIITPLVAGFLFFAKRYIDNPKQKIPFPYLFSAEGSLGELNSPILIVGDRMAKKLERYAYVLQEELSKNSKTKVQIESLALDAEGLHRTLRKLKSLSKLPKIIIYMGASQEWYEKKFYINATDTILENLELYKNPWIASVLMFLPELAPLFYRPMPYVTLSAQPVVEKLDDDILKQKKSELLYKIYEFELNELMNYAKSQGSIFIQINTPVNLDIPPRKICSNAYNAQIKEKIAQAYLKLKKFGGKAIMSDMQMLLVQSPGNAMVYYIKGQAHKEIGEYQKAKQNLEMATALDCGHWRGNQVFNVIQKKVSAQNEVYFFDFHQYLYNQWPQETVFFDELYPQDIYFEQTMKKVAQMLKKILQL